MTHVINIVGIGLSPADLTPNAMKIIQAADVLVGGRRHLAYFPNHAAQRIVLDRNIEQTLRDIKRKYPGKCIVILASGDPNFFGVTPLVCKVFGKKNVCILPNITVFQAACARIRENWEDALFVSLHGRSRAQLNQIPPERSFIIIYCDQINSPARVAQHLVQRNKDLKKCQAWVFENLGQADERILSDKLERLQHQSYAPLSIMIVKKEAEGKKCPQVIPLGIPESAFCFDGNMITKRDARLLVLSRLGCDCSQVVWDIGAGSGSISIEAACLYPGIDIYAVEKNPQRFSQLKKNINTFNTSGVHPILGSAPAILKSLPDPQSVFIGGSGGKLVEILQETKKRLGKNGNLVVNCVTIDTLTQVVQSLKQWQWNYSVALVQIAYVNPHDRPEILRPENPLFIVHGINTHIRHKK